jgi:cytochrome c
MESFMKIIISAFVFSLAAPVFAAGDATKGATVFRGRCSACHSIDAAKPKATAPTLAGVVGRKAGSLPKARYSPGMKALGVVWTPANLDRYLADPRGVVKGGMMLVKVPKPEDRADVIAYLATLKGAPEK